MEEEKPKLTSVKWIAVLSLKIAGSINASVIDSAAP
jgi:hypothetical protein